jgi:hypothetical protein
MVDAYMFDALGGRGRESVGGFSTRHVQGDGRLNDDAVV